MKAPDKIYLQVCGDCNDNDCENCRFEDLEDNVTWCKDKIFKKDIEYTRTDAFIKKACEWIETNMDIHVEYDTATGMPTNEAHIAYKKVVEDFKNYMKGE